jgi:hypothetical protein
VLEEKLRWKSRNCRGPVRSGKQFRERDGTYLHGAGATLGPTMNFAFVAANHITAMILSELNVAKVKNIEI